ncbi:MAG: YfhO family protein, partial [Anaerolineae bacterium]
LFLSEVFYPGWRAEVDGEPAPISRANGFFRAVLVPAGQHRVVLVFSPPSWRVGLGLSLVAWLVAAGVGGLALVRRARRGRVSRGERA